MVNSGGPPCVSVVRQNRPSLSLMPVATGRTHDVPLNQSRRTAQPTSGLPDGVITLPQMVWIVLVGGVGVKVGVAPGVRVGRGVDVAVGGAWS